MTKEDLNITWTRAIACLFVVLVHVAELWVYYAPINSYSYKLTLLIVIVGRTSVPLFFMISGYLLFSKNVEPTVHVLWKRFSSICFPILYFFGVYYVYSVLRGYSPNPVNNYFLTENIAHLWYLGFILPVYTFSPFIRLPKLENKKQIFGILGFVLFFFFITESLMTDPYPFNGQYHFNQPLLYMFTGYLLKHIEVKRLRIKSICWVAFILLSLITFLLGLYEKEVFRSVLTNQWFNALTYIFGGAQTKILPAFKTLGVFFQSVFLFVAIQSLNITRTMGRVKRFINKTFSLIAKHSFPIYGWHMLFVNLFREILITLNIRYAFPLIFLCAVPCSIGVGYVSSYIKYLFSPKK